MSLFKNKESSESFIGFLKKISKKEIDKTAQLYIIGRKDVLKRYGVAPYYQNIEERIKKGMGTFYLIAEGKGYVPAAKVLSELLVKKGIAEIDESYVGRQKFENKKIEVAIFCMTSSKNKGEEALFYF